VTNTTVVGQQTIHASGPGKILVRFDGWIESAPGDRIVLAASNNMSWGFNDGAVAVEAVNAGDVTENSFSHTRVYNVPNAGDYTYYAVAQNYGKTAGTGQIWVGGNILTEFFPTAGTETVAFKGFTLPMIDLNDGPASLTTINFTVEEPGKVMLVLDGYSTADTGYTIIVAASLDENYSNNDGSIRLKALDLDQNRYSFSHTRVYNISSGPHTFYAVGEITGGNGSKTGDLFGALTVKYIPFSSTPVEDISAGKYEFEIYPNPTRDDVYIRLRNVIDPKTNIKLLDVNGSVIKEYPYSNELEFKIDLSELSANQYWVQIGEQVKPLVKQ
ncbi:MAG TPA: T9SS type A sorting domain-containing protein, partial [Saprospiraceae bacterium]|nr:T9SS type A sorting domain-containing protein [Saprospiraceae bacterium]